MIPTTKSAPSVGMALALLLLTACAGASSRPPNTAAAPSDSTAITSITAAAAIAQLQAQWRKALMTGDTTFLARVLADEFQLTGGQTVLSKAEFLVAVAGDSGRVPPSRTEETRVHVYGNVAVVTGLIRYEMPGGAASLPSRFTEVWVKQGEHWRAVHGHYNPIQAPPRTPGR